MQMETHTITRLIASILLFLAVLHLPYGYYTLMKIAVTAIAAYNAYESRNDVQKLWLIFFIAAAIVFNPFIPIYLKHRSAWMPVDIIFGIIFLLSTSQKVKGG
jgi:CDP-diglyceride synthetase